MRLRALLGVSMSLCGASAQESSAIFDAAVCALPVDCAPCQRLFDPDQDGDLDGVGTRIRSDGQAAEVWLFRNEHGRFVPQLWTTLTGTVGASSNGGFARRSMAVTIGDFDGDGRSDFFVVGHAVAARFLARSGWTFQREPVALPETCEFAECAAGDLDGDGSDDVAVTDFEPARLHVLFANGSAWSTALPLPGMSHVRIADVHGSPSPEVLVWSPALPELLRLQIVGGVGVPLPMLTTTVSPHGPYLWSAGDVDRDGDADVVVFASGAPSRYQVLRRVAPTQVDFEPVAVGGPAEYLADVDGDGDLDGVCCAGGGGGGGAWPMLDFRSTFEVTLNDGTGAFGASWAFPGAGSQSLAGVGDLDRDGDIDLVAGRCVYYSPGGVFRPLPPAVGEGASWQPGARDVHDVDRDGDVDVVASPWTGALHAGDGTFSSFQLPVSGLPPGRNLGGGTQLDHDGDGADDWVTTLHSATGFEGVVWFRNNGGGTWTYGGPVASPSSYLGITSALSGVDADGDGDEDLVFHDSAPAIGGIFWNHAGAFVPGPVFPDQRILGAADFDGDGRQDLLAPFRRNLAIERWSAAGRQHLTPGYPFFQLDHEPRLTTIADVNDDGRPDIVYAASGRVGVFVNTSLAGDVTFLDVPLGLEVPQQLDPLPPACSAVADFDGDGRTDLVIAGLRRGPGVAAILLRQSPAGTVPGLADYRIVLQVIPDGFGTDAERDGDVDLLGSFLARNRRFHGTTAGSKRQYGVPTAGESGCAPVLGARTALREGVDKQLSLTGTAGPTAGVLAIGLAAADLHLWPGLRLLVDPGVLFTTGWVVQASGGGLAAAESTLQVPLPIGLAGLRFHDQVFLLDPAGPRGVVASNGLEVRIGR